ncbi:hypothetical protein [Carnobacterium maltaromaticum]|uniref:hypothetical protein n=1 Tax=Carnobacterium maltaromaticum TaxID=2751 RepID=UPI00165AC862|nr:hypothetical protein [Carnobacterium maltaromaticum]MBC9787168.1 hypothetical protein [Carnobacterium maltaromaticum]
MANEVQIPLDPNPLGPMEPIFFIGTITPLSKVYADFVRSKLFGKHVREALARGILIASIDANEAKDIARIANAKSDETSERQDELEERWETVLAETTDGAEVIDARTDIYGVAHKTLKRRMDAMQENEIILFKYDEVNHIRTILDNEFSNNHEVTVVQQVESDDKMPGLIIAEIDNPTQNRFKFEKVGSI